MFPFKMEQEKFKTNKKEKNIPLKSTVLTNKNLRTSMSGKIYECAKSRRERNRVSLMENNNSDSAIPLGRSGKRGPHRTSSMCMARHEDKDDDPGDEKEYAMKAEIRITHIRHTLATKNKNNRLKMNKTAPSFNSSTMVRKRSNITNDQNSSQKNARLMKLIAKKSKKSS